MILNNFRYEAVHWPRGRASRYTTMALPLVLEHTTRLDLAAHA